MAYGFLVESRISADNVDALNLSAQSTVNVDGGNLVSLTAPTTQGDDVWTATTPSATTLGGLYVAYNPSGKYIVDENGNVYANLSSDPRAYTNLANAPYDVFKLKKGNQIVITINNVDSTSSAIVAGDYLEAKAGQSTWTRVAQATGATAGSTAVQVEWVGVLSFPPAKNTIGLSTLTVYKCCCVAE